MLSVRIQGPFAFCPVSCLRFGILSGFLVSCLSEKKNEKLFNKRCDEGKVAYY